MRRPRGDGLVSDPLDEAAIREGYALLRRHITDVIARASNGGATQAAARGVEDVMVRAWEPLLRAVRSLASAKVVGARVILVGSQPVQRVTLHLPKTATVDPHALLLGALEAQNGTKYHNVLGMAPEALRAFVSAVEPAFDAVLAQVKADVANRVAKMMLDGEVVGRIKGRLAKKRELERVKAFEATKHHFKNLGGILSREDVVQAWDEVLCAQVMDS